MTAAEVLDLTAMAGVSLAVGEAGALVARPGSAITDELRAGIRETKDQLVAILKLRQVHRLMGFDETDVLMIEKALLSGQVNNVVIVAAPAGTVA